MKSYNFAKDIKAIRQIFEMNQNAFANAVGLSRSNIIRYEQNQITPHKSALEKIYSYSFDNGLNINKAKEMLFQDEKGDRLLLFHGAKDEIVDQIKHNHINGRKDFGGGFYLGESLDSAAMWVSDRANGSCYCFYFPIDNTLKSLTFKVNREWMYAILFFRGAFEGRPLPKEIQNIIDRINFFI